jgi:hypothetical protein
MKRVLSMFLVIILLINARIFANAADCNYTIEELKKDPVILQEIRDKIFPYDYMQRYCDGLMGSHFDAVYYHSNEGLFLYLYEVIYEDSKSWLANEIVKYDNGREVILHDTAEERKLRIQRLLSDGYITPEEVNQAIITKETVANILYRIYGQHIPFKKSVDYTDTTNIAVEWAAEAGLPCFNYRSGFCIYPEEIINVSEYSTIMTYVYLYFPKAQKDEYNPADEFFNESVNEFIHKIRQEIKKPRLGYWKRDVMNNTELKDLVARYQSKKRESDLKEIHKKLKEQFNLFNYQDYIGYVRYMFTLYE